MGAEKESLDLELYKALRAEAAGYVEKVPGLWMQKLLLVGAVVAFLVSEPLTNITEAKKELGLVAVAVLPVLAILIDAKMLEYALHARAISRFIIETFRQHDKAVAWERAMWGESGNTVVLRLTRARSAMTWLATAGPTVVILVGAGVVIEHILNNGRGTLVPLAVVAVAYLGATAWAAMMVYSVGAREDRAKGGKMTG